MPIHFYVIIFSAAQILNSTFTTLETTIELDTSNFNILNAWWEDCIASQLYRQNYYKVGSYRITGCHLSRKKSATLNRIWSGYEKCRFLMHKRGYDPSLRVWLWPKYSDYFTNCKQVLKSKYQQNTRKLRNCNSKCYRMDFGWCTICIKNLV